MKPDEAAHLERVREAVAALRMAVWSALLFARPRERLEAAYALALAELDAREREG